jgi:ribosomal 30S subunit maturation factor RimM
MFASGRRMFAGTSRGELWRDADTGESRELVVVGSRPFKGGLIVALDSIADRTQAELWRDRHLLVAADEVAEPGDGEIFLRDLEGMRVLDEGGAEIAVVQAWYEVPSGILLDLRSGAREATVPFNAHFVRDVNRSARTMTAVIPPELWHGRAKEP